MTDRIVDAPLLVSPTGTLVIGASYIKGDAGSPQELLRAALGTGRQVFVGVLATEEEVQEIQEKLGEAAAEAVATSYRERG